MPFESLTRTADPWQVWGAFAAMAVAAVWGLRRFLHSIHLSRLLTDLPVANIRSASQGYVQLQGQARMLGGEPVIAPLSGKPCVWYRFVVEQRERDPEHDYPVGGWRSVEQGLSDAIFALEDGTGRCVIDPDGAEVTPSVTVVWRGREPRPGFSPKSPRWWNLLLGTGPYRYTESRIHQTDPLGAVGHFETLGSGPVSSPDEEVRRVLSSWKKDRATLLRRFDRNRDGTIDLAEWDFAQRAAEQEVAAAVPPPIDHVVIHVLKKPRDGRPFCLFTAEPQAMVKRYRCGALTGGALFLGMVLLLAWGVYVRLGA
ncbi:MAG: E3 ubiquitin ligase family protein [Methylotetracoccus sp.]|nr:E3 ubiquitin ligase family protein [Methylotetracoccus sp.]